MDPVLPPPPLDDRWTRKAMRLADLEVVLGVDHALAVDWVEGLTTTLLGTSIVLREPLFPTVESPGIDAHLPLVAVAGVTLLAAIHEAGAAPDNLRSIIRDTDVDHGGPVVASRLAASALPQALLTAANEYGDASLLSPLARAGDGWVFTDAVAEVLAGFSYDADGWVTQVRITEAGAARIAVRADGCRVLPEGRDARLAAAVALFRRGRALEDAAAVVACEVADVEAAIRELI